MIWLVGCNGMLGQELGKVLADNGLEWVGTDKELDFTDLTKVSDFVHKNRPQWIVNCAAYTAVDKAEDEPQLAYMLNVTGPENLGKAAQAIGSKVIHISTDYVFDGKGIRDSSGEPRGYKEDDPVAPTGVYGKTKSEGELALQKYCNQSIILRTAWLYGFFGSNFVYTMLRLMNERDSLGVISDQWGSPTWTYDLSMAIVTIINNETNAFGIFHFTGIGKCNWYDFVTEIYRVGSEQGLLLKKCEINPLTTDQYPTKAKRPEWSVLDKSKILNTYSVHIPHWDDSLNIFMKTIKDRGEK